MDKEDIEDKKAMRKAFYEVFIKSGKNPYKDWLPKFECYSFREMYFKLGLIARESQSFSKPPFSLADLESAKIENPDIVSFLYYCWKLDSAFGSFKYIIELIQFLKKNPPKVTYKNPHLATTTLATEDIIGENTRNINIHTLWYGIDLPGSKYNPKGMGYFSDLVMDMFLGNYTEFMEHINKMSGAELKKTLQRREGFCQFNLIFFPIEGGEKMTRKTALPGIELEEFIEFKTMFSGNNENKHLEILGKLLELGADPNAHDIGGYTPLHHLVKTPTPDLKIEMIQLILKHGANPNIKSKDDFKPLDIFPELGPSQIRMIDILVQHKAKTTSPERTHEIRLAAECKGTLDMAVRIREGLPRGKYECEKCGGRASKKCSACSRVFYCTPSCQKLDWKFHKGSCISKKKSNKK